MSNNAWPTGVRVNADGTSTPIYDQMRMSGVDASGVARTAEQTAAFAAHAEQALARRQQAEQRRSRAAEDRVVDVSGAEVEPPPPRDRVAVDVIETAAPTRDDRPSTPSRAASAEPRQTYGPIADRAATSSSVPTPAPPVVPVANVPVAAEAPPRQTPLRWPDEADEDGDFGDFGEARTPSGPLADADAAVAQHRPQAQLWNRAGPDTDPLTVLLQRQTDRLGSNPRDLAAQLDLQLLRLLAGQPTPSLADLSALDASDRELIAAAVDAVANFRGVMTHDRGALASQKARPLLDLAERLRGRGDLTLPTATLASAVRGYANYDAIDPLRFPAQTPSVAVFYCEVDGFQTQLNEKQLWETRLSLELRLYTDTDAGLQVWDTRTDTIVDQARRQRRDFFLNKRITLPPSLAPGRYLLKATVRDLQANRVAESTIPIMIEAR